MSVPPVGRALFKILRQVDDFDGLKGTLLHADTASNAELFAQESDLTVSINDDTLLPHAHHWTLAFALHEFTKHHQEGGWQGG